MATHRELYPFYGDYTEAQTVFDEVFGVEFSTLSSLKDKIEAYIKNKYHYWTLPWPKVTKPPLGDIATNIYFRGALQALCGKFEKLPELVALYGEIGGEGDGTFKEEWSGSDHKKTTRNPVTAERTFEDNLVRQTQNRYNGVGDTDTQKLSSLTVDGPTDGSNTQKETTKTTYDGTDDEETERGTARMYSDGRTKEERLAAMFEAGSPVLDFINAMACILVEPTHEDLEEIFGEE